MSLKPEFVRKLCAIAEKVRSIEKKGFNSFHRYKYAMEADYLTSIRNLLFEQGIFVFTSVSNVQSEWIETTDDSGRVKRFCFASIKLSHEITDGDSSIVVSSAGSGIDTQDKALYKATTGAMKYFIAKTFLIPTGDDPEQDETVEHEQAEIVDSHAAAGGVAATKKDLDALHPPAAKAAKPKQQEQPDHSVLAYQKFLSTMEAERARVGDEIFFAIVTDVSGDPDYHKIPADALFVQEALFWQLKAVIPDEEFQKKHTTEEIAAKAKTIMEKLAGEKE